METPTSITRDHDAGVLRVDWPNGRSDALDYHALRMACHCAHCVHELTGELLIVESNIPEDIHPVEMKLVGNYALKIMWSDGHDTGLFTWDRLSQMKSG